MNAKPYDFSAKQSQYKNLSDAAILWSLDDARQARDAASTYSAERESYYADDMATLLQVARERGLR